MVKHHKEHYGGKFPIWVVVELFTIGQLSFFYSDMIRADKKAIAKELYGTTDKNVESWIKCLTDLRNFCAHYSRLYNANLVSIPATPDGFSYRLKRKVFDYIIVLKLASAFLILKFFLIMYNNLYSFQNYLYLMSKYGIFSLY